MKAGLTLIAATLVVGMSFGSVSTHAQSVCTEAEIAKLETAASQMTDAAKKAAVMKHVSAAREQMKSQQLENCRFSMQAAQTAMSGG